VAAHLQSDSGRAAASTLLVSGRRGA